jgi:hypothetical protein
MDVFGRTDQVLLGGLSSDSLFMTWPDLVGLGNVGGVPGGGGLGMLIQRVAIDYSQNLRRVFEIGPGVVPVDVGGGDIVLFNGTICDGATDPGTLGACADRTQPTYYIVSRPEGNIQANKFIGPQALGQCFYRKYGSPCGANIMTMSGKAGCSASDASAKVMTWILNGVVCNKINMEVNGQEMVMQDGFNAMFVGLNVLVDGGDGCPATGGST